MKKRTIERQEMKKKTGKRMIAGMLASFLLLGTLTGCGGSNTPGSEPSSAGGKKTEISVAVMNSSSELAIMKALKTAYEEKNSSVSVRITTINEAYNDYVVRMIAAKQLPDVLYTLDTKVNYLASEGAFVALDDIIADAGIDLADYYESVIESARPLEDGKMYYVPRDYNRIVTEINVDMFEEAGLNAEDYKDWNWETFKEVCQKLQDYGNANKSEKTFRKFIYPVDAQLNWGAIYSPIIRSFGGELFDVESGTPGFSSPETKAALTEMYAFVQKNYSCTPQDATSDLFAEGKAAMRFASRPNLTTAVKNGINVDFLPFPAIDSNTTGSPDTTPYVGYGSTGYALCNGEYTASDSEEVQAAAEDFICFIMSREGQEAVSATGDIIPMLKSLGEDSNSTWRNWSFGSGDSAYTTADKNQDAFLSSLSTDSFAAYLQGYAGNRQITLYDEYDALMKNFFTGYGGKGGVEAFAEYADSRINDKK